MKASEVIKNHPNLPNDLKKELEKLGERRIITGNDPYIFNLIIKLNHHIHPESKKDYDEMKKELYSLESPSCRLLCRLFAGGSNG